MDRLYKAVCDKMDEGGKFQRALFNFACEYKRRQYEAGFDTPLLDKSVTYSISVCPSVCPYVCALVSVFVVVVCLLIV